MTQQNLQTETHKALLTQFLQNSLSKNKVIISQLEKGMVDESIRQLKEQYNELSMISPRENIEEMQKLKIVIMTNLACAYRKKQKYKISLFYLKSVQVLEKMLKISDKETGLTHSNICAIYSEMNKHADAYKQIKIAINKLQASLSLQFDQEVAENLVICYHNYSIQCEYLKQYNNGLECIEKALTSCEQFHLNQSYIFKLLQETKARLKQKKSKEDIKQINLYKKHKRHKSYLGNVNNKLDILNLHKTVTKNTPQKTFVISKKKYSNISLKNTEYASMQEKEPNLHQNSQYKFVAFEQKNATNTRSKPKSQKNNVRNWSFYEPWSNRSDKQYLPKLSKTLTKFSKNEKTQKVETSIEPTAEQRNPKNKQQFRRKKFEKKNE